MAVLIDTAAAAVLLGVRPVTVRKYIADGKLTVRGRGRRRVAMLDLDEVDALGKERASTHA